MTLPQLSGSVFIADGGMETTLIFHHAWAGALADPADTLFTQCLARFYAGQPDPRTLALCGTMGA